MHYFFYKILSFSVETYIMMYLKCMRSFVQFPSTDDVQILSLCTPMGQFWVEMYGICKLGSFQTAPGDSGQVTHMYVKIMP